MIASDQIHKIQVIAYAKPNRSEVIFDFHTSNPESWKTLKSMNNFYFRIHRERINNTLSGTVLN